MSTFIDLTGQKFSKLTVIERDHSQYKRVYWICKCECGNITSVPSCDLRSGHTRSCGCMKHESHNISHGLKQTRIYKIWCDMRKRCNNIASKSYKDYGAKGIFVCDVWDHDFLPFYNWAINNGYGENLTIDRIDTTKGYSPDNCRWVTRIEQNRNRRNTVLVKNIDEYVPLSKLCEDLHFPYKKASQRAYRLKKKGISLEVTNIFY